MRDEDELIGRLPFGGGAFERFKGDEPPDFFTPRRATRQWGRRVLLAANGFAPAIGTPPLTGVNTLIETHDLGRTYPINVQLRFAESDTDGNAILPFSAAFPTSFVSQFGCRFTVRRGTDMVAPVTSDEYIVQNPFGGTAGQVLPFDIVTARSLGVDVEFFDTGSGLPEGIWVEAIATIVTDIGDQNKIQGYGVSTLQGVLAAVATPANTVLLPAHADRRQFVVVNTSTNADMILCFGEGASWGPPNVVGTIILPKNTFATYQSPVGGYTGIVSASWNDPAPNGGALVTEGTYF